MTNIKKILITISIFLLSFGQIANAGWEPSQEVEIVAHAKETSSTVAFARAVIKVIEEENLLPRNIATQIFKAFLENSASEQGSRMTAMDNATRNAGDLVDKLTINYNRSRQASITKELIEIISGAESL